MTQYEHNRDDKGRCTVCLKYAEKTALIEQATKATGWRREVLLTQLRNL